MLGIPSRPVPSREVREVRRSRSRSTRARSVDSSPPARAGRARVFKRTHTLQLKIPITTLTRSYLLSILCAHTTSYIHATAPKKIRDRDGGRGTEDARPQRRDCVRLCAIVCVCENISRALAIREPMKTPRGWSSTSRFFVAALPVAAGEIRRVRF